MDQPGKVANPARGQLNRENNIPLLSPYMPENLVSRVWIANPARVVSLTGKNNIPLSPYAPENLVSRNGFSRPVPRQPVRLQTQAESGAYLRDSSRIPRRRPFIYFKPPYAIGSVPSLSGHAIIAYRWRLHHVPVWQPRILLGMVEARSVNVKNTTQQ